MSLDLFGTSERQIGRRGSNACNRPKSCEPGRASAPVIPLEFTEYLTQLSIFQNRDDLKLKQVAPSSRPFIELRRIVCLGKHPPYRGTVPSPQHLHAIRWPGSSFKEISIPPP
jgi:hypothetical protein